MSDIEPLVFISYSWTSERHKGVVKDIADRLLDAGVEVIIDIYDLKEGDDRFKFMEQMVTRPDVTHVLVVSDRSYVEKANHRKKGGVGTESQIISKEVYNTVVDSKFIPLIFEFDESGEALLPAFFVSRIGIDFSTPEAQNLNWEQLVRRLYGKPLHRKPEKGAQPAYLTEVESSASFLHFKFRNLKSALEEGRLAASSLRREYIDLCISKAEELRVRTPQSDDQDAFADAVISDYVTLKGVRNAFVDWVVIEWSINRDSPHVEILVETLERLLEIAARSPELNQWHESWFEAERIFVYETFIYTTAALLKLKADRALREIFDHSYLRPPSSSYGDAFCRFDHFCHNSNVLNGKLAPPGKRLFSPVAALIKKNADRSDVTYQQLMEADLLAFTAACVDDRARWFPNLLHYASTGEPFPLFLRAARQKDFGRLVAILGEDDVEKLKKRVGEGYQRMGINHHESSFHLQDVIFRGLSPDKWASL